MNPTPTSMTEVARKIGLDRNPLRRRTDRIETAVVVMAGLAAALVVPVACALGSRAQASEAADAASARAVLYATSAATLRDAVATLGSPADRGPTLVSARWADRAGRAHSGLVSVDPGTKAGASVPIWVDARGRLRARPATHAETIVVGVATSLVVLLFSWATIALISAGVRRLLAYRRLQRWEREWRRVAQSWTRWG